MDGISFKRKGRRSMLGTRQLKLFPIEPITEKSPSEENASLFKQPDPAPIAEPVIQEKEPLDEPTIENPVNEEVSEEPESAQDDDRLVIKAVRKNLICSLFPDDSFEANETMLANSSFNETVLATTLLMTANKKADGVLTRKSNEEIPSKKKDESLQQALDTVRSLLKKNAEAVENNKQEREILTEMKNRVLEKIQK